jgi:hypothetical protein
MSATIDGSAWSAVCVIGLFVGAPAPVGGVFSMSGTDLAGSARVIGAAVNADRPGTYAINNGTLLIGNASWVAATGTMTITTLTTTGATGTFSFTAAGNGARVVSGGAFNVTF